ncbi:MAG: hypothetical protein GY943_27530 [Chloroflexi bacterium]|nr:hypothetical protein [Chloroflexota bacterium]
MQVENSINPRKITLFLGTISLYLAMQSLIGEYLLENVLSGESDGMITLLIDLFSVNLEESIPTWYATLLLFISAGLLAFIAAAKSKKKDAYTRYWIGLAIIFLYLSMDEGAAIHEIVVDPLQAMFNTTGYLTFAWQIVFVPLVLVFALVYLRFLFHLPSRIRNYVILAGVLYVGGAIVIEGISANRWYLDGGVSFPYLAIATVEELSEMLGVVVFIYALLLHARGEAYTAVTHFSTNAHATEDTANKTLQLSKWMVTAIVVAIVGLNIALGYWAMQQQVIYAASDLSTTPFYQEISRQYAGQGVIILQVNELIEPGNVAAQQYASSVLTLFDDVLIVTLPNEQSSIAFASHSLPFNQNQLSEIVQQHGETEFTILNTFALQAIVDEAYP